MIRLHCLRIGYSYNFNNKNNNELRNVNNYVSQDDKYLSAHGIITAIVELAQSRNIALHKLLHGTGIFEQDLLSYDAVFSLSQLVRLIVQFKKLMGCSDSGFLLGSQLVNDTAHAAQTLLYSANLGQAFLQLNTLRLQLAPLFFDQSHLRQGRYYVFLQPAYGLDDDLERYILEIYGAAFYSLLKRLSGQYPQCEFDFSFKRPRHIHQYEQHLGLKVRFEQPCTRWVINTSLLRSANPQASSLRFKQTQSLMQTQVLAPYTFVEAVWRYLYAHADISLEQTAQHFAMSSATFKRKLKQHGVRFSALVDSQNTHKAIYLLTLKSQCNEQVAQRLAFYDIPNFRRAFKRWTGITPSQLKI
jgi:AraC-like DNA-binding protein